MHAEQMLRRSSIVEFVKGGISHGMKGQVKKIRDDREHVEVVVIPVEDKENPLKLDWRISDIQVL